MYLTETLEHADKSLLALGFSLTNHADGEHRILISEGLDTHTKTSRLRKFYIRRLKVMIPFMENQAAKDRAVKTINNLLGQDNELIGNS